VSDFEKLVEPHRASLRLHCYRMLGSSHDSDDMVLETLLRAYRARDTLDQPAAVRGWLYRIATNVCLTELEKRPRRIRGPERGPPGEPEQPLPEATPESEWIEPVPSAWLGKSDPAAAYTAKESVALAFIAALQVLTPAQRAVLLLRDVVGLSAEETAGALSTTLPAANSALHRARVALEARVGPRAAWSPEQEQPVDRALLERYLAAWESGDLSVIVALPHEEVTLSMPPLPSWFSGREQARRFFGWRLEKMLRERLFRARAIDVNGRPGAAYYRARDDGFAELFAIDALEYRDGLVVSVDHFMGPAARAAFLAGGLMPTIRA
jgi:RNA polymerase sigma-70 factor (ECF subfamily)